MNISTSYAQANSVCFWYINACTICMHAILNCGGMWVKALEINSDFVEMQWWENDKTYSRGSVCVGGWSNLIWNKECQICIFYNGFWLTVYTCGVMQQNNSKNMPWIFFALLKICICCFICRAQTINEAPANGSKTALKVYFDHNREYGKTRKNTAKCDLFDN